MIPINQKNCVVSRKNLGIPDCVIQEGRLTGFIIVPKGWSLDLETGEFDKEYVDGKIQSGEFVPVLGAVQAENKTPEATTEEFQGGVKTVVRNGLPEFTFKFVKGGWKWASALYTYNSFQAFDVLFVFSSGAIAGATDGKNLTGFDLGMLNNGTYMFTDGTASSYVLVTIQLTNEVQFNRDVALLDSSVLDFNPNFDIQPITDIVMRGEAIVADGKIYFTAGFAMNENTPLKALQISNVKLKVNGVDVVIPQAGMVYDDIKGKYVITPTTPPVAQDKNIISLWDTTSSTGVTKVGNRMYKGQTDEFTAE
jgi:hypothetical protein